jgi:hypothetical protein
MLGIPIDTALKSKTASNVMSMVNSEDDYSGSEDDDDMVEEEEEEDESSSLTSKLLDLKS